ncbi:MAG: ribbon-helix-helix domain-containing protein [Thermoplasmata archaeon]
MSKMVPVGVQFTQEELERIDRSVERRGYGSRSEYIRDMVRRYTLTLYSKEFGRICEERGITKEEMVETIKKVREELWEEE